MLLEEHRLPLKIFNSQGQGCGARELYRKFQFLVGSAIKGQQGGPVEMLSKQLRRRQEFNKQSRWTMARTEIMLFVSWV